MKFTLSLQAASNQQTGRLVLHVAAVLQQTEINLEKLIGTEPLGTGIRFWVVVVQDSEERVQKLAAALAAIPGVSNVRIEQTTTGSAAPFAVFERPAPTDWSI